eukprot:3099046-Rhodomonas_salina.2
MSATRIPACDCTVLMAPASECGARVGLPRSHRSVVRYATLLSESHVAGTSLVRHVRELSFSACDMIQGLGCCSTY